MIQWKRSLLILQAAMLMCDDPRSLHLLSLWLIAVGELLKAVNCTCLHVVVHVNVENECMHSTAYHRFKGTKLQEREREWSQVHDPDGSDTDMPSSTRLHQRRCA